MSTRAGLSPDTGRATAADPVTRSIVDAWLAAGAVILLAVVTLPISPHAVAGAEKAVFRAIDDHTLAPFALVWPVMQLGSLAAIPACAAVAALLRRWRLTVAILVGGLATYEGAKLVKMAVERGRPSALLDHVTTRGGSPGGLGYVSGHAAVVSLIATVAWPYLGRRMRVVAVAVAVAVCLARVYVGAHLPLDVVGGAALGTSVGLIVRVALGRPAVKHPSRFRPGYGPAKELVMTTSRSKTALRVIACVVGAVLIVVGALATLAGAVVTAAFGSDGRMTTGAHPLTTPTVALVSEVSSIQDTSGVATVTGRPTLRLSLTPRGSGGPLFVGIGRARDVDRYLAGAPIDRITNLDLEPYKLTTTPRNGTRTPAAPTAQTFWVAKASGADATMKWRIRDGSYRVVVMNADASPGVDASGRLSLTLPRVYRIAIGVLVGGIVILLLGGGVLLLGILGLVKGSRRRPVTGYGAEHPAPSGPPAPPPPAPRTADEPAVEHGRDTAT